MEKITRKSLADSVSERWREQYPCPDHSKPVSAWALKMEAIGKALDALGQSKDPEEVERIIGNETWTEVPECDECGCKSDAVVMIGEPPDYESATAWICKKCLEKALELMSCTKEGPCVQS